MRVKKKWLEKGQSTTKPNLCSYKEENYFCYSAKQLFIEKYTQMCYVWTSETGNQAWLATNMFALLIKFPKKTAKANEIYFPYYAFTSMLYFLPYKLNTSYIIFQTFHNTEYEES